MKTLLSILTTCLLASQLTACSAQQRLNPVVPDGAAAVSVMDFATPISLDPVPPGWRHRTFFRTDPMTISFASKEGRPAIRLATANSASMLYRETEIPLDRYPRLVWSWYVEQPIESELDEDSKAGDDHPARLFLTFRKADQKTRSLEIIWGNRTLKEGDWKYLTSPWNSNRFPHYVARGGNENVGRWHDETVDLRTLYRHEWGDPTGAELIEIALFCDTDATGAKSVAYFSTVRVERAAP